MQKRLSAMVKEDKKIEKKLGCSYLWDAETVTHIIAQNMVDEADYDFEWAKYMAVFIAYRLKFADSKTIMLMQDAIYHHKKHFTDKIAGKYTIYETMQLYCCDYYHALFIQYKESSHAKKSKYATDFHMPPEHNGYKMKCTELSEDGSHIIFMSREDWEAKYGPVEINLDNVDENDPKIKYWINCFGEPIGPCSIGGSYKPKTLEEEAELERKYKDHMQKINEEIKKWEQKLGKKENKWTKEEDDDFKNYIKSLRKTGIDI